MKKYDEGHERLALSAIKQYAYCARRFALMFIDNEWGENYKIVEGDILHKKVNDPFLKEKRPGVRISRSVPVFSDTYDIYGVCDVVEFFECGKINPVEYKRGKPEKSGADELQLCAQAVCIEEMFDTKIETGDLYYGSLRKRATIPITLELRTKTIDTINAINIILGSGAIPPRPTGQNCRLCSLIGICTPKIFDIKSTNKSRIEGG